MWRLVLVWVILSARPLAPGVTSWPAGPCAVDYYHGRALVLACPGRDLLRLYPWPPAAPFFEEDHPAPPASQVVVLPPS